MICVFSQLRFRDTCRLIYDVKLSLPALAADAYFSLTQAEFVAGLRLVVVFITR